MDNSVLFHCVSIVHAYIIHKQHVIIVIHSDTVMAILSHEAGFEALRFRTKYDSTPTGRTKSDLTPKTKSDLIPRTKSDVKQKTKSHLTPMRMLIEHLPGYYRHWLYQLSVLTE